MEEGEHLRSCWTNLFLEECYVAGKGREVKFIPGVTVLLMEHNFSVSFH